MSPRRPFSHKARSPRVKTHSFTAQPPGLRRLSLDHESFAELCPLALLGNAFYPVLVHRLAVSLHASSPQSVTLMQLRFASFAVINLRWDFHPQECARAGRTQKKARLESQPGLAHTSLVADEVITWLNHRRSCRSHPRPGSRRRLLSPARARSRAPPSPARCRRSQASPPCRSSR